MARFTKLNLKEDVEDQAVKFGFAPNMEMRMARDPLALEQSGLTYQRIAPNFRIPFGHRHKQQEEVFVVIAGGGRMKLDGELVELRQWDAVRVPSETMRGFEAGGDGAELLIIGAPNTGSGDVELDRDWWRD